MVETNPTSESSLNFRLGMKINRGLVIAKTAIEGEENLEKLPEDKTPVIAVTHIFSDTDVQTAAAYLVDHFDLGIALQSTNRENPAINTLMTLAGQDNFFDVEFKEENGIKKYTFNPEDYEKMKDSMMEGKAQLIAAHPPAYNRELPDRAGFGAIYLSQLSRQGLVLPVSVEFHTDKNIGRIDDIKTTIYERVVHHPKATVRLSNPLEFPLIPMDELSDMTKMIMAITNYKQSGLPPERYRQAKQTYRQLTRQAETVMDALASTLPQQMRGEWGRTIPTIE